MRHTVSPVALPASLILDDPGGAPGVRAGDIAGRVRSVDPRIGHVLFDFDKGGRGLVETRKRGRARQVAGKRPVGWDHG